MPRPLAGELFDKLTSYYADDDNVTVIVDRRVAERRTPGSSGGGGARTIRDRRKRPHADRQPTGAAAAAD